MKKSNKMKDRVEEYLAFRRALGVKLSIAGKQLQEFAQLADKLAPGKPLTLDLALRWAQLSRGDRPIGPARRLEVIRPFALFLRVIDPETEIPPRGFVGPAHRRLQPHIYREQEIRSLLEEASRLLPEGGLRPQTVRTYLGLLYSTGMRPNEPLRLVCDDVDLQAGTITIRETKFAKSRLIPLHSTVTQALRTYVRIRNQHIHKPENPSFFLLDDKGPLTYRKALTAFKRVRRKLGWPRNGKRPPRLYDLRHTFVSGRLLAWYKEGVDVHTTIPALSTYLGHVKVTDTYWYVTGLPELMAIAGSRFEQFATKKGQ